MPGIQGFGEGLDHFLGQIPAFMGDILAVLINDQGPEQAQPRRVQADSLGGLQPGPALARGIGGQPQAMAGLHPGLTALAGVHALFKNKHQGGAIEPEIEGDGGAVPLREDGLGGLGHGEGRDPRPEGQGDQ